MPGDTVISSVWQSQIVYIHVSNMEWEVGKKSLLIKINTARHRWKMRTSKSKLKQPI